MTSIFFNDLDTKSSLLHKRKFKDFIANIFRDENRWLERVDIIFCSDAYLLDLNKKFLNHNFYTDTLTFVLSKANEPLLGEVYISIDRIKANSIDFRDTYQNELARVVIHGCLHLCGYEDKPTNQALMIKRQEEYLINWFVSRET
ncbi:MAG: rRNA maturation RNase YbeY [Chitinophagaceae bacterium]